MKKTLVSLAAAAALTTGAMAADKGVDLAVSGQAVIYYETKATDAAGDPGMFNKSNTIGNAGIQLNVGGSVGNGFTLDTQFSGLSVLGLENNLGSNARLDTDQTFKSITDTASQLMLTKMSLNKKIGNTDVTIGRMELPKSISPFAYSEGWNVFKNTFDAYVFSNTDLPATTVVAAYVSGANTTYGGDSAIIDSMDNGLVDGSYGIGANMGTFNVMNPMEVYMATAVNKSVPMLALTGSYLSSQPGMMATLAGSSTVTDKMYVEAKVAGKSLPMGLGLAVQYASVSNDVDGSEDTTGLGVKVSAKPMAGLAVKVAYSSVNDGTAGKIDNATGVKSPLYTQMIYNQGFIKSDSDTIVVNAAYNAGSMGKFIAQYGMSTYNASTTENEYTELDLIYKVKTGGVTYWASAMLRDIDGFADNKVRLWARLGF